MISTQNIVQKTMVKHKGTDFTREEQLLLQDFSQNVSTKSSALFYGNAFIISAIPGGLGTSYMSLLKQLYRKFSTKPGNLNR